MTVAPLSEALSLPIVTDELLRERMNLEPGDDPQKFYEAWARAGRDRAWTPPSGRSSLATACDMQTALSAHVAAGESVVYAVHGGATTDLLRSLLSDQTLEKQAPNLVERGMPGGAITTLIHAGGQWSVASIADVRHIPLTARTGHQPA